MERRQPHSVPEAPPAHTSVMFSARTTTAGSVPLLLPRDSAPPPPLPKNPQDQLEGSTLGKMPLAEVNSLQPGDVQAAEPKQHTLPLALLPQAQHQCSSQPNVTLMREMH